MMKSENRQNGFSIIKLLVKLAILAILVAIVVPKVIPILQNQETVSYMKSIAGSMNAYSGNSLQANVDPDADADTDSTVPIYKQVIDYVPNVMTAYNMKIIVSAVQAYRYENDGDLPQSDTDVESCLSKPIASFGPPGATYSLTYTPSVVTVIGTSPTSAVYSSEQLKSNN